MLIHNLFPLFVSQETLLYHTFGLKYLKNKKEMIIKKVFR